MSGIENRFSHGNIADKDDNDSSEIAGNLELDEATDVHVDVASPLDSLNARVEVVVLQNHRGTVSSDRGTISDGKGNISRLEGLNIVDTLSDNGNLSLFFSAGSKSGNKTKLILRLGSSDDLEFIEAFVESSLVVRSEAVGSSLFSTLFNIIFLSNDLANNLSEVSSIHGDRPVSSLNSLKFLLGDDSNVTGNGSSSHEVISGDNLKFNVRISSFLD